MDKYVESLAAHIHAAAEEWFERNDPYHLVSPRWFALRDDLKEPYRDAAKNLIEQQAVLQEDAG